MKSAAVLCATLAVLSSVCAVLPPVPGLETASGAQGSLFGRGYDPMTGEVKNGVFDYTYNDNRIWTNPESGMQFRIPDQVELFDTPSSQTSYSMDFISDLETWYSYEEKESWSSFNIIVVSFSHASQNGYVKQVLKGNTTDIVHSSWVDTTFKLTAWSPELIKMYMEDGRNQSHSRFAMDQAALPKSRSTDEEIQAYDLFLATYGTHWVHDSIFGGEVHVFLQTNKSLVASKGQSWASSQSSFGLDIIFIDFGFMSGSKKVFSQITSEFQENTEVVLAAYGGDSAAVDEDSQFHTWSSSVHLNPAPINSTYYPISDLILDPTVAQLYQDHVNEYLSKDPGAPYDQQRCGSPIGYHGTLKDVYNIPDSAPAPPPKEVAVERRLSADVVPIPGMHSGVGQGYDAKKGVYMDAVTTFTFNDGKQWYDGLLNTIYTVPDALTFVNTPSTCGLETVFDFRNDSSVAEAMSSMTGFGIGISIDGIGIGFSFQQSQGEMRALTHNWENYVGLAARQETLYQLTYDGAPEHFDPNFQAMINALPSTASDKYDYLIQYWGTHYVAGAQFGGFCNFTVLWDSNFTKTQSSSWITEQIGIQIGIQMEDIGIGIDLGFGFTHMHGKADSSFTKGSKSTFTCVGGDVSLLKTGQYDEWISTLLRTPTLVPNSLQLRPISALVYDPVKRGLLNDAITKYLNSK